MIRTLIVEDDKSSHEYLSAMLNRHFPEIEVLEVIENIPDAIVSVRKLNPDLIFLDIDLPPFTGFNLLEETRDQNYHTIFTTSFDNYATKAFKYSAIHYLEKPYGLDELNQAISFYKKRVSYNPIDTAAITTDIIGKKAETALLHNLKTSLENQVIGIPILGGIDFYPIRNIIWCKADNNYTEIHMEGKIRIIATQTLKRVEMLLTDHNFFRIHKSYLINLNHMTKYIRGYGGEVVMIDNKVICVARNKKELFMKLLKAKGLISITGC